MQERYWRYITQLKAECMYVETYIERSDWMNSRISIFTAIVASTSVSAWAVWKTYDWIWAFLVAASQVLNVVKQYLPFTKRLGSLKPLSYSCQQLFIKAESNWHAVASGELTDAEINQLLADYKAESLAAWKKGVGEVVIPVNNRFRKIADQKTADYFSQAYGVTATVEQ